MSDAPKSRHWLWIGGACALHVLLFALAGPGFNSSDDEVYTRLANAMARGEFALEPEHRANRLGLIAPTALIYATLGVGRWTTVIWPLLWSLAGIVAVGGVARRLAGAGTGVAAAFLFAPLTIVVGGSAFLMPDGPVGVQMFLATAALWIARQERGRRAGAWGAASALLVAVGVTTKLTVLWLGPFFAALFVVDVVRRRNAAAWLGFVAAGLVAAAVFFGAYAAATGDPLYRVNAVSEQHNDTHWAYEDATTAELLERLSYAPALMWARSLPELLLLAALALAALIGHGGDADDSRARWYWAVGGAVVIGGFWVGTTSFARIAPLPLLPRMLAPSAGPLAVLAAAALTDGVRDRRRLLPVLLLLGGGLVIVALDARGLVAVLYAGAAAVAAVALVAGRVSVRRWAALAVIAVPVAMIGYSIVRRGAAESRAMALERRFVPALASHASPDAVVLTDRRSERTFRFYRGYEPAPPRVLAWDELTALPDADAETYVYWHAPRIAWRDGRAAPPEWLAALVDGGEVVWKSPQARLVRLAP